MKEYKINENIAKTAKELNGFGDYKPNSATFEYRLYLNRFEENVNELINEFPQNINDEVLNLIEYYKDKYSKKLAYAINKQNSIESMMPSILITGGGNFNCRKKQKQNNARDNFWREYGELFDENNYYFNKIRTIITNKTIFSDDAMAIEKLGAKITEAEEQQQFMKEVNAYYRKHKTLDGCELLNEEAKEKIEQSMRIVTWYDAPYPTFELTNNLANIKRLKDRVEEIKRLKERAENKTDNKYIKIDGLEVVEDAIDMRIRLIFDSIPNANIRDKLKNNGFKWSPKNNAWQRQLTANGIYATKKVLNEIKEEI